MQPLKFRCPRTGREIGSGIQAEPGALMRLFSVRLRCPACEDLHEWHVSEGLLPAHKVAVIDPFTSRFTPTRATSHEVLRDLGMSDGEIAAYLHRFSDVQMNLFACVYEKTGAIYASRRMQNMPNSFEDLGPY